MAEFLAQCNTPNPHHYTSQFEETIDRKLGMRSADLQLLVYAIKDAIKGAPPQQLNLILELFDGWRTDNPREFAARFASHASDFLDQLARKGATESPNAFLFTPPAAAFNHFRHPQGQMEKKPEHGWLHGKFEERRGDAAEVVMKGAEVGAEIAERTVAGGAGLVPGVGPFVEMGLDIGAKAVTGLIAAPAAAVALAFVESCLAGRSWHRTSKHLVALKELRKLTHITKDMWCKPAREYKDARAVHSMVGSEILEYIIAQKETKLTKKKVSTFGAGEIVGIYSACRYIKKQYHHERGVERYRMAHWLAYHFCTCDCQLASLIVIALTGHEEAQWLLDNGEYEGIADFLAEKMKSI